MPQQNRRPAAPPTQPLPEIERTVSEIGAKVAKARAERGWSLAQLAERAGLSTASIHKIEKSGMTPTIASLMKVAAALGKSVGYFVEEVEATRPVTVVRADERTRLYTSKQGLELAEHLRPLRPVLGRRRRGPPRAARRQRRRADEPPRRGARAACSTDG